MSATLTDKGWVYVDGTGDEHNALKAPMPGEHDSAEDVYVNLKLLDEALWTYLQAQNLLGTGGTAPSAGDVEASGKDPEDENTDNYYANGTNYLTTLHTHPVPDLVPHAKLATLARLADVATLARAAEKLTRGFTYTVNAGKNTRTTDVFTGDAEDVENVDLKHTHVLDDIVDDIVADYMLNGFSYTINNGLTNTTSSAYVGDKETVQDVDLVHKHQRADIVDGGQYLRRIFYGDTDAATYMGANKITAAEGDVYIRYY